MMIEFIKNDTKYKSMNGMLATRDAHGLYEKYGFAKAADGVFMRKPKEL
jgi:hypothetical protein